MDLSVICFTYPKQDQADDKKCQNDTNAFVYQSRIEYKYLPGICPEDHIGYESVDVKFVKPENDSVEVG